LFYIFDYKLKAIQYYFSILFIVTFVHYFLWQDYKKYVKLIYEIFVLYLYSDF